jgi:hypothetical protein
MNSSMNAGLVPTCWSASCACGAPATAIHRPRTSTSTADLGFIGPDATFREAFKDTAVSMPYDEVGRYNVSRLAPSNGEMANRTIGPLMLRLDQAVALTGSSCHW